jgi:hypothetical protein
MPKRVVNPPHKRNKEKVMRTHARVIPAIAIFFASATILAAQAMESGPFVGTWKLNLAKSKFKPGPAPKSQTVTIAPKGEFTVQEVLSEGTSRTWSFTPSGDSAVPVEGLENTTVLHKRSGHVTEDSWNSKDGAKSKGRGVLSRDGNTVTYTQTGTDKDGRPFHNVTVYERVPS